MRIEPEIFKQKKKMQKTIQSRSDKDITVYMKRSSNFAFPWSLKRFQVNETTSPHVSEANEATCQFALPKKHPQHKLS